MLTPKKAPKTSKLNFKLTDIIRAAIGLAVVDGGFIIAIQIITFLLKYFGTNVQISTDETGSIVGISRAAFLVSMIGILNLAVIIYRVAGLARGLKYSPLTCYQHALRRWPVLILLFIAAGLFVVFTAVPMARFLSMFNANLDHNRLFMFSMMLLIPYGILACIFVVDQERNPLQAIVATFNAIRYRVSLRLLLNIAMLYSLPFLLSASIASGKLAPYLSLLTAVWFLFCHMLIIVIYAGTIMANNEANTKKPSKVLIV